MIENRLHGNTIKDSIIGVGLNINQRVFHSDAPNPVSLWQITGQETHREQLLLDILQRFGRLLSQETVQGQEVRREVRKRYMSLLYRRKGFHGYADDKGSFMAEIVDVEVNGHLLLRDDKAQLRRYAFKELF